jgi:hypothetical protein
MSPNLNPKLQMRSIAQLREVRRRDCIYRAASDRPLLGAILALLDVDLEKRTTINACNGSLYSLKESLTEIVLPLFVPSAISMPFFKSELLKPC